MADPALKLLEDKIVALEQKLNSHITAQSLSQVSKIYPKTKTVVFVGKDYFGDNIKYAFLAFCEFARGKNIECYFFTNDPVQRAFLKTAGLPHLTASDTNYLQIMLSAKIAVLYDNFYPQNVGGPMPHALLQGAKFIQLWHGIPLKEIGLQSFSQAEVMAACGPFAAFIATNASSRGNWAKRFSFREFAPIGYPRNDVLLRDLSKMDLINVDIESLNHVQVSRREGKPVIIYAPTFRDHGGPSWFEKSGIMALADHCKTQGYVFYINLHPSEQGATSTLRQRYPNLQFFAPFTDIYPIVKHADILLTDYSSLAFDFLLLDRPLLFYRPDHEEYVSKSRPLIAGREHYMPGAVTSRMDELIEAVDGAVATVKKPHTDPFRKPRRALRKELFDHRDSKAASRFCKLVTKYLET